MDTSEWLINHDTPGIDVNHGGLMLYQPHVGERLVGVLSGFEVIEPWDNDDPTHPPRLLIWAGPQGSLWNEARTPWHDGCDLRARTGSTVVDNLTDLTGQPGTTDVRFINPSPALQTDAVWEAMTHPLWVMVDNSAGAAPVTTHGSAIIRLTFQTSERHHG